MCQVQRFPNSVLGTPRGAPFGFCHSITQLIQMMNSYSSFGYLNQLCSVRAKTKTCTPWGLKDRVWETLQYMPLVFVVLGYLAKLLA